MSSSRKKPFQGAAKDIDDGLTSLFGALGDAIGEMVARLEDGNTGAVTRDHVFDTSKGPIRAHAGIRLRMGGTDQDIANDTPTPVNAGRAKQASSAPVSKPMAYDLLEDEDEWVLTADVPGVAEGDLKIAQDATALVINTTGTRKYAARIDLETQFAMAGITTILRNGILTVRIQKAPEA